MKSVQIEDRLLATHISNNADFEQACVSGNAKRIMEIVNSEMAKNNLHTKGSEKLKADIFRMTRGQQQVSSDVGTRIMYFVWNSRLSGIGLAVC